MRRLRILPQAVADLDTIWLHIARDNPDAADDIIDHFTERFTALCDFPQLGAACPEIAENLRRTATRGYVIFYSIRGQTLVIERVLHGARDIEALFG